MHATQMITESKLMIPPGPSGLHLHIFILNFTMKDKSAVASLILSMADPLQDYFIDF